MIIAEPPQTPEAAAAYEGDRASDGYVWNVTRLWSWRRDVADAFTALRNTLTDASTLTPRERIVVVAATAAERNDSYCSLAWGSRLATMTDPETAAGVLEGSPAPALTEREAALAEWARQVVRDPNATTERDVAHLREAGLDDREIFEATVWSAFRLAFSTVNDALDAVPDRQLAEGAPEAVRAAVRYGRPPSPEPSRP